MRNRLVLALCVAAGGCDSSAPTVLDGVPAIVYLSRAPAEPGNVFDYTNGGGEANLFTLTPPTASGVKKNLTNWKGADINSFDVSFDARELVFSARPPGEDRYHLFRINVDGTNPCDALAGKRSDGPCQITAGPHDQVYPIYLPGGRLFYVTNENVEGPATPQFRDEYERATTAQAATSALDGSDPVLGPRNVSHRVFPTLLSDGRVLLTEWRHLGDVNEGDLTVLNQDLTGVREAFGRENKGITNSYLRARELEPGKLVAIGTSRDRTFQAGKIVAIKLGGADVSTQSEALSSVEDLTPDVPGDRIPSYPQIGRYYDVAPVGDPAKRQMLVTWADGAVESETLGMAKATPDFGIYLYDAVARTRFPVVNEVGTWEVAPRPILKRAEPPVLKGSFNVEDRVDATLLAAIDVRDSSLFPGIADGAVKKVRITEGFSSEEGFPNNFGLTEFDGQARLGEVDVVNNAFKAMVPANTPVRLQLIDKYGMALQTQGGAATEPVWIQGRAGEARVCGGCHESRTETISIRPGSSVLQALGAAALDYKGKLRAERKSMTFTPDQVMGVPWDLALQPIFDKHCVACHDGSANGANPGYTLTDVTDMTTFSFTFDLTGKPVTLSFGEDMYTYTASHVSLLGPSMALREKQVVVTAGMAPKMYVEPGSAHDSEVIKMLNPPARYPQVDFNDRAFAGMPVHPSEIQQAGLPDGADPRFQLSADEYYLLELMADNGGQFYSRENAPGGY
jgi:hypothetical protein